MLEMDNFMPDIENSNETANKKNSTKFAFVHKKGFKTSMTFLIILTFLSIVYTLVNKLSSPNVNQLYQDIFAKMKAEINNSEMMKNILKIATNVTGIENLSFEYPWKGL